VIDTIPAIAWSALPDGSNSYVNSRFVEYCGMPPEQIAGSGWHAATHPMILSDTTPSGSRALAVANLLRTRCASAARTGNIAGICSVASLSEMKLAHRQWYGVLTDIEDRKRAEDTIREQERELRQMLDFAPQLIGVLGPQSDRLYANRVALSYYGVTLDEWRQRNNGSEVHRTTSTESRHTSTVR